MYSIQMNVHSPFQAHSSMSLTRRVASFGRCSALQSRSCLFACLGNKKRWLPLYQISPELLFKKKKKVCRCLNPASVTVVSMHFPHCHLYLEIFTEVDQWLRKTGRKERWTCWLITWLPKRRLNKLARLYKISYIVEIF